LFSIHHQDASCSARTGRLHLAHGALRTPAFMPVGTAGSVKGLEPKQVAELGFRLILGNTYHLYLRPGLEVLERFGGLHGFTGWPHNILTDSGGFQVFSLSRLRKLRDDGVEFQSHIDGSRHLLTPEKVVEIQRVFGSDIQMALDYCTGFEVERSEAERAVRITTDWAKRAAQAWRSIETGYQGRLFPIVQGNFHHDLRRESAAAICELDLPGIAIGGLSVGEPFGVFEEFVGATAALLPRDKPRYVMGIGTAEYVLTAIEHGVDMFDCVFPTRAGRNGLAFTDRGRVVLKHAAHTESHEPIEAECDCETCRTYSRAYLRHLFKAGELLGPVLVSRHNLRFMSRVVDRARDAIERDAFLPFKQAFLERYNAGSGNSHSVSHLVGGSGG